jgi:predicted transcriptional regulator
VARLDDADLLQALERLAQGLERDPEVGRELALARQLLACRVAAGDDGLEEAREDAVRGVLNSRRGGREATRVLNSG